MTRSTHTYALLELSVAAFEEIAAKLLAAGYDHAFDVSDGKTVIDMHGIGVAPEGLPASPRRASLPMADEITRDALGVVD